MRNGRGNYKRGIGKKHGIANRFQLIYDLSVWKGSEDVCTEFPTLPYKTVEIAATPVESFDISVEKFVYSKKNAVLLQNLFVNWYGLTSINGRPN